MKLPRDKLMTIVRCVAGAALATGLCGALAGCGKRSPPMPPASSPRPTTMGGGVMFTADYRVSKLPKPASPGMM